ncbi:hypothetical protein NX773_14485 [Massilia solisilvae]|uniref:SMP-30/Gluconolactonase/LRE-like region domain-containing protein n=1 Tax=Massilia solisilvae TaxID=1811225 RepID=A0ABT2BMS9_9BURK|nr:hypothetical protein [Massilia solisilvae]MCS0609375.1 hypothetical protein [Massilia solisilvae]
MKNESGWLTGQASPAPGLPRVIRGFHIAGYACVPGPEKLTFAPDGTLYVGQSGSVDRIRRVPPAGGTSAPFGPPQQDPDAVLFDACGRISRVKRSVLVGGNGILAAIFPDGSSAVLFDAGFSDVDDMKFDRSGRLIFSDDAPQVLASAGGPPFVLFATPSRPGSIAIDPDSRIFVALSDGTIRVYNRSGTPAGTFASGLETGLNTYIVFGEGAGGFGRFLYVLSGSTLLRFSANGKGTVIGTGFDSRQASGLGFVFGPDHALYVSDFDHGRVLRIARGER